MNTLPFNPGMVTKAIHILLGLGITQSGPSSKPFTVEVFTHDHLRITVQMNLSANLKFSSATSDEQRINLNIKAIITTRLIPQGHICEDSDANHWMFYFMA
jgi:hypothetical protein